jgi:hypothetical protein
MSSIVNKVKDALHSDKSSSTTHTTGAHHTTTGGTAEGVAGTHNSRVANSADPRIDSDLDGSRTVGNTHSTTHSTNPLTGNHSTTHGATPLTGTTGTHNTHGSTGLPGTGTHGTHSHVDHTGAGSGLTGGTTHSTGYTAPHNSAVANKLDPRVGDTTAHTTGGYSGTHVGNTTGTHTGTTGGISHSTNAGPHNSNLANKADPRVDSDLDGRGNRHGAATGGIIGASGSHATPGSGTAQNTAGPHNSDLLNKADPRIDSDLSGGKTYGGNKTHT